MNNTEIKFRMKLNILEMLYSKSIHESITKAIDFIVKIILSSDSSFTKLIKYNKIISILVNYSLNSLFLFKFSCDIGEYFMKFIQLDTLHLTPFNKQDLRFKMIYSIIKYLTIPLFMEYGQNYNMKTKVISTLYFIIDIIYKLMYIFRQKVIFFDCLSHLFNLFTINEGNNHINDDFLYSNSKQLNMFLLFLFMKVGEWFYSKRNENKEKVVINLPQTASLHNLINSNENPYLDSIKTNIVICNKCNKHPNSPVICRLCGKVFCMICINLVISNSLNEQTPCCNIFISGLYNSLSDSKLNNKCYLRIYDFKNE